MPTENSGVQPPFFPNCTDKRTPELTLETSMSTKPMSKEKIKNLILKVKLSKGEERLLAIRKLLSINPNEKPVDK